MSCEVVGHACILSDLVSVLLFVFFGANIMGVGSWFMMCFFYDPANTWYGLVIYFVMAYWVLSIMFRSFDACHSCVYL